MAIDDEDKTEMLESITASENSSEDMANLINALLEYTRLGKSFKPEIVELNAVIETIRNRANQLIRENQAIIITAPNPLPNVIGDMNLLTQIFQNLITNSIKYRSEEPPVIKISVEVDPDNPSKAEISIADNGLGIDPAYHKKIFQPLERALATTQEGHGIGLATCKTIAERHGGEIWVESQEQGVGLTEQEKVDWDRYGGRWVARTQATPTPEPEPKPDPDPATEPATTPATETPGVGPDLAALFNTLRADLDEGSKNPFARGSTFYFTLNVTGS